MRLFIVGIAVMNGMLCMGETLQAYRQRVLQQTSPKFQHLYATVDRLKKAKEVLDNLTPSETEAPYQRVLDPEQAEKIKLLSGRPATRRYLTPKEIKEMRRALVAFYGLLVREEEALRRLIPEPEKLAEAIENQLIEELDKAEIAERTAAKAAKKIQRAYQIYSKRRTLLEALPLLREQAKQEQAADRIQRFYRAHKERQLQKTPQKTVQEEANVPTRLTWSGVVPLWTYAALDEAPRKKEKATSGFVGLYQKEIEAGVSKLLADKQ